MRNNALKSVLKVQFVQEFSMFVAQMTFDLFNLRASAAEMTTAAAAGYGREMSCRAFDVYGGLIHGRSKAGDSNGR